MSTSGSKIAAALGDSITAGTPLWDPNPAVREEIGEACDEQSQWMYWAARATSGIEFRNHGVNREETGEIAARLDEAVEGADVLVVQGGINDIVHGISVDVAAQNLAAMVRRGKEAGAGTVVTEILPCNGFPEFEEPIKELNELIHELARAEEVSVLPFYSTLEDPATPGRIGPGWTDDGNHPSVAGHQRLGELAFKLP